MSEPTLFETQQLEPVAERFADRPVAVVIEGPVRTQALPSVVGSAKRVILPDDGTAVVVGNSDDGRKRLILLSTDEPFVFGVDKHQVESGFAPLWPIDTPMEWEARDQVWAASGTVDTVCTLTVVEDFWSS